MLPLGKPKIVAKCYFPVVLYFVQDGCLEELLALMSQKTH